MESKNDQAGIYFECGHENAKPRKIGRYWSNDICDECARSIPKLDEAEKLRSRLYEDGTLFTNENDAWRQAFLKRHGFDG